LVIKSAARCTAWIIFAGLFSLLSAAQQTTPPSAPDSSAQTQTPAPAQGQAPASAQQSPPDKDKPAGTDQTGTDTAGADTAAADKDKQDQGTSSQGKVPGTSKDRLGGFLPNFLTLENGGHPPPLTWKQKYHAVALGTFDPVQYPWWAFLASLNQAANSDPQLGQGWEGYAKRYGLVAADGIVENFMAQAVFPSLLHQDPRFFQTSTGSIAHRAGYSISRIVITRSDSGHRQFNFSEIFGAGFAAAISTYSYHPKSGFISTPTDPHKFVGSDRTLASFGTTWGTQIGLDTFTIFLKEFWPDVRRKMSHKKKVQTEGGSSPSVSGP
jgi:hypothetical protein